MGSCVSRPDEGCGGPRLRSSKKKNRKRRKSFKKKMSSRLSDASSDKVDHRSAPPDHRSSFTNQTFQGLFFLLFLFSKVGLFFVLINHFVFAMFLWISVFAIS